MVIDVTLDADLPYLRLACREIHNLSLQRFTDTVFNTVRTSLHARSMEDFLWISQRPAIAHSIRTILVTVNEDSPDSNLYHMLRRASKSLAGVCPNHRINLGVSVASGASLEAIENAIKVLPMVILACSKHLRIPSIILELEHVSSENHQDADLTPFDPLFDWLERVAYDPARPIDIKLQFRAELPESSETTVVFSPGGRHVTMHRLNLLHDHLLSIPNCFQRIETLNLSNCRIAETSLLLQPDIRRLDLDNLRLWTWDLDSEGVEILVPGDWIAAFENLANSTTLNHCRLENIKQGDEQVVVHEWIAEESGLSTVSSQLLSLVDLLMQTQARTKRADNEQDTDTGGNDES